MADEIRADYRQLQQVATQFARQANAINRMQQQMKRSLSALQGNWIGHGSEAFFAEMSDRVLPATARLHRALNDAGKATMQIIAILQRAEQDAAAPFRGATDAPGVPAAGLSGDVADSAGTAAALLGGMLKGVAADTLLTQRFVLRALTPNTARGQATVAALIDLLAGKPGRGLSLMRFDLPHKGTNFPHINLEQALTGFKDPHIKISPALLEAAGKGAHALEAARKIALPVALVTDAFRLGSAFHADGNAVGAETRQAIGGVAGGWAGAFAGAQADAAGGAWLGGIVGSVIPGAGTVVGAGVGGFLGGLAGGIGGGLGGGWLGEQIGELF
ncbi:MAG: hypothetical protein CVU38_02465 [Chloroflexi bacterium HGW-Chloroflexi-1]|nr:MAG: hypothetical protein CVU38_02465 [Chloroflexi bacterium HGW-Chloroflexi-1]